MKLYIFCIIFLPIDGYLMVQIRKRAPSVIGRPRKLWLLTVWHLRPNKPSNWARSTITTALSRRFPPKNWATRHIVLSNPIRISSIFIVELPLCFSPIFAFSYSIETEGEKMAFPHVLLKEERSVRGRGDLLELRESAYQRSSVIR